MNLKDYIEIYGFRQNFLAQRLDITKEYFSDIVCGRKTPSRKLAERIEALTDGKVTRMELLFPETNKERA